MKFYYKARTKDGKLDTGVVDAVSKEAAALLLQRSAIVITSLEQEKTRRPFANAFQIPLKISKKDLAIFSRQLAVMLESSVPVVQSLSSLAGQTHHADFKQTINRLAKYVEQGIPLSEALARFPSVFDQFYINLVRSGEASGKISATLYYLSDHLEREYDIASQIRQAMIYPAFTMAVLFIVVSIIIVFLLPKIEELIRGSSSTLPFYILLILNTYAFLEKFWWLMVAVMVLAIVLAVLFSRTKQGKKIYDTLSLNIPVVGDIFRKAFLARFCGGVSTLLSSGISINTSIRVTKDTIGNTVYKNIISQIEREVSEGEKMSTALMRHQDYFPSFVVQMMRVGEETGKLDKTLMEVVNFYQKEIKKSVDVFLSLLEPVLIVFLGIVVALLAVSIFTPLYGALGTF